MGEALGKWPHYALGTLEQMLLDLQEIERTARQVQLAIDEQNVNHALILLGDVRVMSRQCIENLVRARSGNYKREDKPAWTPSEQAATREKAIAA